MSKKEATTIQGDDMSKKEAPPKKSLQELEVEHNEYYKAVKGHENWPSVLWNKDIPTTVSLELNHAEAEEAIIIEVPTNLWSFISAIDKASAVDDPKNLDAWTIKIYCVPEGAKEETVLLEGPLHRVVQLTLNYLRPPQVAAQNLFEHLNSLLLVAPVKGAIVTLLFEGRKPAMCAMVNRRMGDNLEDEDIDLLAYHAASNVSMFRDAMKKKGHVFGDESKIVTAGGMPIKNTRVVEPGIPE